MMSPELGLGQVDYKAIGRKLLDMPDQMTHSEKGVVFYLGLKYAETLVQNKASELPLYDQQSSDMKEYINGATLGRIITLHEKALRQGSINAESVVVFDELKRGVCDALSVNVEDMQDDVFNTFFKEMNDLYLDAELDRIDPQPQEMRQVREAILPKIVAENPEVEEKESSIKHTLD